MTALSERLWMCTVIVLTAALLLSCGGRTMNTRVTLPPLPASVSAPCQDVKVLGSDDPALIWTANTYHMKALADCAINHSAIVQAYEAARKLNP